MKKQEGQMSRFFWGFCLRVKIAPLSVKGKPVLLVHFADAAADAAGRMTASI